MKCPKCGIEYEGSICPICGESSTLSLKKRSNRKIKIYWIFDGGKTKSLYWAGTFELPTSSGNSFTWVSKSNTEKASQSVMASQDGTKTFTYQDGKISYQVSALGNTTTVELQKQ